MFLRPMSVYIDADIKILYIVYVFFIFVIIFKYTCIEKIEVCILKILQPSKHIQTHTKKGGYILTIHCSTVNN
jgi:hypothetical protein